MRDPIVIDPPNFDMKAEWDECRAWVDKHEPGSMAGAAGADPGVCSCPACHEMYWAWGRSQRCVSCGFEYPTDAWAMFSWGTQAKWRKYRGVNSLDSYDAKRLWHPYFCYGYEHGPKQDDVTPAGKGDLHDTYESMDWRTIMATYDGHLKHEKPKPRQMSPETAKLVSDSMRAREAIVASIGKWNSYKDESKSGAIDCPVCGKEKSLRFSRAGCNGHIHAGCTTENCVAWME